jgi:chromodomain-helicase-DNA-binding protein 4
VVLTGTPLQNELPELFSLLHFLQIEPFARSADFEEQVQQFSVWNQKGHIEKLHEKLRPHMLRRLKSEVLKSIPPKSEYIVRVEMSPLQKQYYKGILTRNFKFLQHAARVGVGPLRNILVSLCKVCNHPYLFPDSEPESGTEDEQNQRLIEASGKLHLLDRMLPSLQKDNHRVVIFSQMTHMLDVLEDWLDYRNVSYTRVDGRVGGAERQSRIDMFNKENSPYFAMLCSTRACRLGINLTSADTVIIYDSDWNPHNDLQALSRQSVCCE